MAKIKLLQKSFLHGFGVLLYVAAVGWFMSSHADRNLPQNILTPIAILMLLVLSVAVVGMLIFAAPIMMYLDGQKKEALMVTIYTIIWLAVFTVIVMIIINLFYLQNTVIQRLNA